MPDQFIFGKGVNPGRLRREILDEPDITTQLTVINASSGVLTAVEINFAANLSTLEEDALSGVVSGHIPLPLKEVTPIVNTLEGLSGVVNLTVNEDAVISAQQVDDLNANLDITTGMPSASGALLDQHETELQVLTTVSGLFGTEYQKTSFDNETSTTANDYVSVVKLTTTSLVGGLYRIGWKWEGKIDNESTRNPYRVRLDDSINLAKHGNGSQNDRWASSAGWQTELLSAGVHDVDIQFRRSAGGSTVTMRNLHIEIWRVL